MQQINSAIELANSEKQESHDKRTEIIQLYMLAGETAFAQKNAATVREMFEKAIGLIDDPSMREKAKQREQQLISQLAK
jgi:hypothetical protein